MDAAKPALIRETFPVGPLQCNCTIIGDPITKKAIVVDPGGNHELILARLEALGLKVVSIIHTHAHLCPTPRYLRRIAGWMTMKSWRVAVAWRCTRLVTHRAP